MTRVQMIDQVAAWFRSAGVGRRNAVIGGSALLGLGVLLFAASGQPETPAAPVAVGQEQEPFKGAIPNPPPADDGAAREAAWEAAFKRMVQADEESLRACEARIAACSAFFADRNRGAAAFAEELLGIEGKLRVAGGVIENGLNAIGELLGASPAGTDSFTRHVESRFRELVISPAQVRQATREAFSGYAGDVRQIEGRLLVDLRADLGDDALAFASPDAAPLSADDESIVQQVASDAANDLGATLVKFIISAIVSDAVTDKVTDKDDSFLKRQGTNFAIGMAMDKALDEAALAAGYDPQKQIEAKVKAALARLAAGIVEGDKNCGDAFLKLSYLRNLHPDGRLRDTAAEAMTAMERSPNIGLRARLLSLHWSRVRARSVALSHHILGPGVPPRLTQTVNVGANTPETLIEFANKCSRIFGGNWP
jgi:hypothetical protein